MARSAAAGPRGLGTGPGGGCPARRVSTSMREELRVEAEIAAGRARAVAEEARTLTRAAPFRERRWALLARALYLSGRQTEALEVLHRARVLLRDELGLDPGEELVSLEEAILRQDPDLDGPGGRRGQRRCVPTAACCPTSPRTPSRSSVGTRRSRLVSRKLRAEGVLAVVGPSGTGKSSLVRAGVVASLVQRRGAAWWSPLRAPARWTRWPGCRRARPWPVLVVDQAEEAVTLCADPGERAEYLARLEAYARSRRCSPCGRTGSVTSRRPQRRAECSSAGSTCRVPMSEENLRAAIEGPARHAGLRLEPGLVDLLVREVDGEPGALPLLSHALRRTWELREGATLTVEGYRRSGGIRDAVAQSAENLYDGLDDRQRAHAARHVPAPGGARRRRVGRSGRASRGPGSRSTTSHERLIEAAGRRAAAEQRRGRRPDRARGAGPRVAAPARLARGGRRGPAHLPAPVDDRGGVGRDGPPGQRALPGCPARGGRRLGRTQQRRAHRGRAASSWPGRRPSRSASCGRRSAATGACGCRWPASPCSWWRPGRRVPRCRRSQTIRPPGKARGRRRPGGRLPPALGAGARRDRARPGPAARGRGHPPGRLAHRSLGAVLDPGQELPAPRCRPRRRPCRRSRSGRTAPSSLVASAVSRRTTAPRWTRSAPRRWDRSPPSRSVRAAGCWPTPRTPSRPGVRARPAAGAPRRRRIAAAAPARRHHPEVVRLGRRPRLQRRRHATGRGRDVLRRRETTPGGRSGTWPVRPGRSAR